MARAPHPSACFATTLALLLSPLSACDLPAREAECVACEEDVPPPPVRTLTPEQRQRILRLASESIPADPGAARTHGPYFFVLSEDPETDRLPLKQTSAEVHIAGVIASVEVTQVYANEGTHTLEAIYIFPASTRAAVHALTMTVGGRLIEARIRERATAREEYEQAREAGQTASLLEQQRPNVLQMNVANIRPGDEVRVALSYTELLVPEDRRYEFVYPTVVGPRYAHPARLAAAPQSEGWVANPYLPEGATPVTPFDLTATIAGGVPVAGVMSPSHELEVEFARDDTRVHITLAEPAAAGNRDVVLRYRLAGDAIQTGLLLYPGAEERFFLMVLEPPERTVPEAVLPREYIFIIDVSGSMHGFPLDTSKALLRDLLAELQPRDHFNVLLFAGGSAVLAERSLPATRANRRRAMTWIGGQRGGGGTELLPALRRALALPRPSPDISRTVVLATDGYVRVAAEAFELVRQELGNANLFPFGIGASVNRHLIEGLARTGLGEPFVVLQPGEATTQAARFREYISAPLLRDIEIELDGIDAYDVEPLAMPDLFASRPLVVFGKYRGAAEGRIVIRGQTPAGELWEELDLEDADASAEHAALRHLWARSRIARLADLNRLSALDARVEEVTRLGLKYSLLTEYTSFVAVDPRVRAAEDETRTVRQPQPLPQGVSSHAVGGSAKAARRAELKQKVQRKGVLGVIGSGGGQSSSGNATGGGPGLRGVGGGGGGYGAGLGGGGYGTVGRGGAVGVGRGTVTGRLAARREKTAAPRIASARVEIRGALSRTAIQRVLRTQQKRIKLCWERELKKDPALKGRIEVRFTIGADGTVQKVEIASSTMQSAAVEACIEKTVQGLHFPRVPGGGVVVVTYPYVFF